MKLKTFQGKTMAEALARVKQQFGRDAVILSTRTTSAGGVLGLGARPRVEITAARRMSDLPQVLRRGTVKERTGGAAEVDGAANNVSPPRQDNRPGHDDAIRSEIGTIKSMVMELARESRRARTPEVPAELLDTYVQLIQTQLGEEIARELIDRTRQELSTRELADRSFVRAHLAKLLTAMVPTAGPIDLNAQQGPTIIAFVGPTGVGKTTTIAKLASNFWLREQRRVGLITIDTYRIAAVEQLRTYAEIIDVPLEVVASPAELKDAVARLQDRDVILVDTAGRSQRDEVKINELKDFFSVVKPHEVHLVLSSTCHQGVMTEAIDRFRKIGIDRVIFTKLDEAIGFGVLVSCLREAEPRLSYLTTGQDVPDDIAVAEGRALAQLVLGKPLVLSG